MTQEISDRAAAAVAEPKKTRRRWSPAESEELYDVARWGHGYFSVSGAGHLCVHPDREPLRAIDIKSLIDDLLERGVEPPLLLRFGGILEHRVKEIQDAFDLAIAENSYRNHHYSVYPIKVNQQRQVVERILAAGRPHGWGLEAGSKPELLAVIAIADDRTPIVCNGFKDHEYIETVMLATKMGRHITPVVEKATELDLVIELARTYGVRPRIGVRAKLASRGAGRWRTSSGYGSKFGLTAGEILDAVARLREVGMLDRLKLLHFHVGSQITNIRQIKEAVTEGARIYADLKRAGAGLEVLDVGGGLGVDYDGSQTNFESSVNYTLQEYVNDVIYHVQNVCDDATIEHPTIVTECGRAISAYHSVLVTNVLGTSSYGHRAILKSLADEAPQPLHDLLDTHDTLGKKNLTECYHDAQAALDEALSLFRLGYLNLEQRGAAEDLFWRICRRIRRLARDLEELPEELEGLDSQLVDTYFCNFSVFQSMPDSWAIDQLFPILPIDRLEQRPDHLGVLGDISCDSDGKIDQFIDLRDVKKTLPLHEPGDQPYYLAFCLLGAYQEILGDLHNLLGDTNAVHVELEPSGQLVIDELVRGDTVSEVLAYVQFDAKELVRRMRSDLEAAVRDGRIDARTSGRMLRFYERGLQGYAYLEGARGPDD